MTHHIREADEQAPNYNFVSMRKTLHRILGRMENVKSGSMIGVRERRDRYFQGEGTAFAKAWWSEKASNGGTWAGCKGDDTSRTGSGREMRTLV